MRSALSVFILLPLKTFIMRKLFRFISVTALLITLTLVEAKAQSITYTTQSKQARELARMGTKHVANAEIELAYADFKEALKLDPGFTYAQLFSCKSFSRRLKKNCIRSRPGAVLKINLRVKK